MTMEHDLSRPTEIAIIGAGFSGTMVAVQLLRQACQPLIVHLIEQTPRQFARGVAYDTEAECHLLNVSAGNMSAFPDNPEHFLRWAKAHEPDLLDSPCVEAVTDKSFLPRRAYGDYLTWVLEQAEQSVLPGVRLIRTFDEVTDLRIEPAYVDVHFNSGKILQVGRVVLALGNFPPGNPTRINFTFYESPRYHGNPWAASVIPALLQTESCLLIGSGLTMVDLAVTLSQSGYRGKIHVLSRRGLWPKAHVPGSPAVFAIDTEAKPARTRAWLKIIRKHLYNTNDDWRSVIDALRPSSQNLWKSLGLQEKRLFLRHLRPYWDLHRHRLAPAIAKRLEALVNSGQLIRHSGRTLDFRETENTVEVNIQRRNSDEVETLNVTAVVNCSGSESNYRKLESLLIKNLLAQGLVCPDTLGLGLKVGENGALIDAADTLSEQLFTLGPPQKGFLWETTAVPEIRVQAANLASLLLADTSLKPLIE